MERKGKITFFRVTKFKDPHIAVWHMASPPTFKINLNKTRDYTRPAYAHSHFENWNNVLIKCLEIRRKLRIPIEKFDVHGSTTYKTEDLQESLRLLDAETPKSMI